MEVKMGPSSLRSRIRGARRTFRFWFLAVVMAFGVSGLPAQTREPYVETFDRGPGGWTANRNDPLPVWDGVAYCFGPWFVDPNHAPPGAGYLHLLMFLITTGKWIRPDHPGNAFVAEHKSTDLRNAVVTLRLRGLFDQPTRSAATTLPRPGEVTMGLQGSQLVLLVQAETAGTTANMVLTGQPFRITRDWSEQSVRLVPDPAQWTCLGARRDHRSYGCAEIAEVLKDVNLDIILILFPLKIVPIGKVEDPHGSRAGEAYPVDQTALPKGLLMVDTVKIEYPAR
jgi:hypothetical protein